MTVPLRNLEWGEMELYGRTRTMGPVKVHVRDIVGSAEGPERRHTKKERETRRKAGKMEKAAK